MQPRSTPLSEALPDRLLTASDVAALLNVPVRWVRERTRAGDIPCVRLGRYVRYRRDSVVQWVEETEQGGRRR